MISSYHSDKKSWVLKGLSLFVIFTFLLTQTDVQLVFAFGVSPNAVLPSADISKNDKIHYMNDLTDLQAKSTNGQDPLNSVDPNKVPANPLAGTTPPVATRPIADSFWTEQNPLGKINVAGTETTDTLTGIKTMSYSDNTYFKFDPTNNRITEICDLTKLRLVNGQKVVGNDGKDIYDLETRRFDYGPGQTPNYVQVTTIVPGGTDTYQKFSVDAAGQLGGLLETGYAFVSGGTPTTVATAIYGTDETTYCDRTNDPTFFIQRVYEKLPGGESRLIRYTNVQGVVSPVDFEVRYDDTKGTMTVIDRSAGGARNFLMKNDTACILGGSATLEITGPVGGTTAFQCQDNQGVGFFTGTVKVDSYAAVRVNGIGSLGAGTIQLAGGTAQFRNNGTTNNVTITCSI